MHTDEKRWTRVQTNSFSWKKNEDRRMCHRASRATVLRACSHARGIKRHADAQNRWRKTSSTFFCARRCRLRRSRSTKHPFPRSRFRPMITQSFVSFLLSVFLLGGFFPRERQSRSLHLSIRTRANLASIERRANLIPRNVYLPQS